MKKQQHQQLGREILQAAKTLFLKHGYGDTSMRKIAGKVGISPTTIYLYYKNKAAVMHALHQEGFKLLNDRFKTLTYVEHPFERLKAMGMCYIEFALENPGLYEMMFMMKEPLKHLEDPKEVDPGWEEGESAFQILQTVIEDCQARGYFEAYHPEQLALLLWANMHGLCALNNNGHLGLVSGKISPERPVWQIMEDSFSLYVKIIEQL